MFCKLTVSETTLDRLFAVSDSLDMDVEKLLNKMMDDVSGGKFNDNDG